MEKKILKKMENNEKELKAYMHNLVEKKANKVRNLLHFILVFTLFLLLSLSFVWLWSLDGEPWLTVKSVSASLIVSVLIGVIAVLIMQCRYDNIIGQCEQKLIILGIEDAKEDIDDDICKNLIKISYKYLDEYYLQTRQQAQKGFVITVSVSILGAMIVAIGIGAMFLGKTTPAYVTTASGVITEFIAAIFFYLYNKTISSMSNYHNKLVLSQNVSIALKIAESLSNEVGENTKSHIVEELMKDINTHIHSEEQK